MLNLRLTSLLASMVLCGIFVSCNNEGEYKHGNEAIITEEVKARFTSLGFNVSDLTTTTGREMVDPAEESGVYLFDGDLVVSKSDLQNMLAGEYVEGGPRLEQHQLKFHAYFWYQLLTFRYRSISCEWFRRRIGRLARLFSF